MEASRAPRILLAGDFHLMYNAGLARGLHARGAAVRLLTRAHDLEFGGVPGEMRSFVARTLDGTVRHAALSGRSSDPKSLRQVARIRREVGVFDPDVVHLQDQILNDPRLVLASGIRPGGYALTVHDPEYHPGQAADSFGRAAGRRKLIAGAALLFVHGEALREELIELEAPSAPVVVVPHGVSQAPVEPLPTVPTILFFGRLSIYKGLDTLLDAMPIVWERLPEARLTVAGNGTLDAHPVLADDRVTLHHRHVAEDEVPGLFGQSTLLALPYRQASQSGVGSLAKRYGRAMVATSVGSLPELVPPDVGRIVSPEDPAALAAGLLEVLTTPGLAESLGRRSAQSGYAQAGWPRVAELTLAAYWKHLLPVRD